MGRFQFYIYAIAITVAAPAIFLRYWLKGRRQQAYRSRIGERFGALPYSLVQGPIWVHAVSVGETTAAIPLVRNLKQSVGGPALMSCVTPTASALIQNKMQDEVDHVYAPVDIRAVVERFITRIAPRALIIIETELWPNLIYACIGRKIPVAFANMRISDDTFRKAMRVRKLCQFIFKHVSVFCVQSPLDAQRVIALGARSSAVTVTGNLKLDVPLPEDTKSQGRALRNRFGEQRETIILGSSHEGEEELFMQLFAELRKQYPKLLGIVVPRHPERFDQVVEVAEKNGLNTIRRSQWTGEVDRSCDLIVVDCMGELLEFYSAADVAVVGGSFVDAGGHNILEPLLVDVPPVFGPYMSNFRELSELVLKHEAGSQVSDLGELCQTVSQYLSEPKLCKSTAANGAKMIQANRGALHTTCGLLEAVIMRQ